MRDGEDRAPFAERGHDLYETGPEAVHALLKVERLPFTLWEPACGPGAIVRILRDARHDVIATDLVDYGLEASTGGIDFLMERVALAPCIVTNPPFKLATQFARHAVALCPHVVMLLRFAFLEGTQRSDLLDGGKLARVYLFRNRLPRMHRAGWTGRKASSRVAYAWFVWDAYHDGSPPQIHRITWEPVP